MSTRVPHRGGIAEGRRPAPAGSAAIPPRPGRLGGSRAARSLRGSRARLLALLVAAMIAFAVAPISNNLRGRPNKDYDLWYRTGRIVLQGGEVYPKDHRPFPFMYPPSCAVLLALASRAGRHAFVPLLVGVNSAAWLAGAALATRLAAGTGGRPHPLLYLVPSLGVIPFIHDTYLLGQPNLLLLALMLGAFACLARGRDGWAGVLIALAAAVKAFPVLAVGYLAYRRRTRGVVAAVVTLAALLLAAPAAALGPRRAWDDLRTWTRGMVLKYDADGIAQRPERCFSFKNQSLMGLANRLLRPIPADGEADAAWKVNLVALEFRAVNVVIALVALGLCAAFAWAMPPRSRRSARSDAAEWAVLLILILILSPLSFNYSYVWLLFPLAVATATALEAPAGSPARRWRLAWPAAALALLAAAIPWLRAAQAYGNVLAAGLVLMIGLIGSLSRWRRVATAPAPAS